MILKLAEHVRASAFITLAFSIVALGCGGDGKSNSTQGKDAGDKNGNGKDAGADGGGKSGGGGTGGSSSTGSPDGGDGTGGKSGGTGGKSGGTGGKAGGKDAGDGTGGSNAGDDDSGSDDPCADITSPCTKGGATCTNDTLVTCKKNADGCLVETTKDCTMGGTDFCDSSAKPAVCKVDPCAGLANACASASTSCNGLNLITCKKNADGCLVQTTTDCTMDGNHNFCDDTGKAKCVTEPCKDANGVDKTDVCLVSETTCADNVLVTCSDDGEGCFTAHRKDCTTDSGNNYCKSTGTPACAYDACRVEANCLTAGKTCDGTRIVDCELNNHGCLVKTTTNCNTAAGETCDVASHMCPACHDDTGCERSGGKVDGDSTCATNTLTTCKDTDGNTCLNKVTQTCGTKYTCDAANDRCNFNGETCSGTLTAVLPLNSTSVQYNTDTDTPVSNYGNYTCPQLQGNGFTAAAPDSLFAIDVPPKTVIQVKLLNPSAGFSNGGGSGAWVQLLTSCADGAAQAEASCRAIGRSPSYANEGNTPVRLYVTVDADGTNATVGTFALEVDSHAFACGDGIRDGSEACDDGNIRSDDGCTTTCAAESGYLCTNGTPTSASICTRRPSDGICGNVQCSTAPANTTTCCTPQADCGVTWATGFGATCFKTGQEGAADNECPNENSFVPLVSDNLTGCCRPDHKCGLQLGNGVGCAERTETWLGMQDGIGRFLYTGPFAAKSCTP